MQNGQRARGSQPSDPTTPLIEACALTPQSATFGTLVYPLALVAPDRTTDGPVPGRVGLKYTRTGGELNDVTRCRGLFKLVPSVPSRLR